MSDAYDKDLNEKKIETIDYGIAVEDMGKNAVLIPFHDKRKKDYDDYVVVRKNNEIQVIGILHGHLSDNNSYHSIENVLYVKIKDEKVDDFARSKLENIIKNIYSWPEKIVYRK